MTLLCQWNPKEYPQGSRFIMLLRDNFGTTQWEKSEERKDEDKDDGNHGQPRPWQQGSQEENTISMLSDGCTFASASLPVSWAHLFDMPPTWNKKNCWKKKQEQGSTEAKKVAMAVNHRKCTEAFWTAWFERTGRGRWGRPPGGVWRCLCLHTAESGQHTWRVWQSSAPTNKITNYYNT